VHRAAAALICGFALAYAWLLLTPCDDAYIFLVYARNWLDGHGLTFNGARVQGFTSALWMSVLTALGLTGMPLPALAVAASAACGVAAVWATYYLGRVLQLDQWQALAAAALLAATGDAAFYAGSGLEQSLFTALVAFNVGYAFSREPRSLLRGVGLPLGFAVMVLTRPEGALIAAMLLLILAWSSRSLSAAVRAGVVLSLLVVPTLCAARWYYGDWLPNTYRVKAAWFEGSRNGINYIRLALMHRYAPVLYPTAALLVIAVVRRRTDLLWSVAPLFLLLAVWLGHVVAVGGDNMVGGRMLLPVLPLLYVAFLQLSGMISARWAAIGLALVAVLLVVAYRTDAIVQAHRAGWQRDYGTRLAVGEHLRSHFPPDTLVALSAAGIIPFYSQLPTIDMLGLNDVHIAHHGKRDVTLPFGHQAGDGHYVLSRQPGVILFGALTAAPTSLISDREIGASAEFRRDYELQQWPFGAGYVRRGIAPIPSAVD
jgi:arabinofuranosyltransferase